MVRHLALLAGVAASAALTGAVVAQAAGQQAYGSEKIGRSAAERECLARAMYFESNKSAEDGMLAVGTVVANRLKSGRHGASLCGVVAQHRQFAPGVMSRRMDGKAAERARRIAQAVLDGRRHPGVGDAMFFHAAGLRFRYANMHYVTVSGGNIFYEKRSAGTAAAARGNALSMARAYAAEKTHKKAALPVLLAAANVPLPVAAPVREKTAPARVAPAAFGHRILPTDSFAVVSAYRGSEPLAPAAGSALAAVAALAPKSKRVVVPAAPMQAAMGPVAAAPSAKDPRANAVVAQAWAAIASFAYQSPR